MPDKPFVINDRRKFTADGEARQDIESATATATLPHAAEPDRSENEPEKPHKEPIAFPTFTPKSPSSEPDRSEDEPDYDDRAAARTHETIAFPSGARSEDQDEEEANLPPLTAEQREQAARAYAATIERLDTALRANNLGSEPLPEMTFERFVQSLYMQALMQLGGAAEPGQAPQVDLLGARTTIDMLTLFATKSEGNLSENEDRLIESALFELHMGFLEITQALARQAAGRQPGGAPGQGKGPGLIH
jgi:hypothetical protein